MDERNHDSDGGPPDDKREGKPSSPAEAVAGPTPTEPGSAPLPAIEADPATWLPRAAAGGASAVSALRAPEPEAPPVEPVDPPAGDEEVAPVPPPSESPPSAEPSPPEVSAGEVVAAEAEDVRAVEPPSPVPELPPAPAPVEHAAEGLALAPALAADGEQAAAETVLPAEPATEDSPSTPLEPLAARQEPPFDEAARMPDDDRQPPVALRPEAGPPETITELTISTQAESSSTQAEPDAEPPPALEPAAAAARIEPAALSQPSAAATATEARPTMAASPPAPSVALPAPPVPDTARRRVRLAARVMGGALVSLAALVLTLIVLYRWVDPPLSTLMLGQWLAGDTIDQRWVPLRRISPNLRLAAIMSEDGRFCRHRGVDWSELSEAIESARDGTPRGGSTISMQVVKNLFLWPSKSYIRKGIEVPLTYVIEALWSKRRILEIYLNIAEWGPGVFGAEAASRFHFGKRASQLSLREAALLAVSLPNPFTRQAGDPGPGTSRLARNLLVRMRTGRANAFCVRARSSASRGRAAGNTQ